MVKASRGPSWGKDVGGVGANGVKIGGCASLGMDEGCIVIFGVKDGSTEPADGPAIVHEGPVEIADRA